MAYSKKSDNYLSNTTTYSGSDITAIAYRDKESPAIIFLKSQLQKEIQEIETLMESETKEYNGQIADNEKRIANVRRLNTINENARQQAELSQKLEEFSNTQFNSNSGYAPSYKEPSFFNNSPEQGGLAGLSLVKQNEDFMGVLQNENAKTISEAEADNAVISEKLQNSLQKLRTTQEIAKAKLKELNVPPLIVLGSLHTISYSSFREKFAVRSLGRVGAKGYTHGPRTIAGTMVFNVLQSHELYELAVRQNENNAGSHPDAIMLDQIEPFNLLLMFANEFGVYSSLHLFDVTIQSEGQSMSIDEVITQNTMNFYALEMLPMTSLGNAFESTDQMIYEIINENKRKMASIKGSGYNFSEISAPRFETVTSTIQNQKDIQQMLESTRGLF